MKEGELVGENVGRYVRAVRGRQSWREMAYLARSYRLAQEGTRERRRWKDKKLRGKFIRSPIRKANVKKKSTEEDIKLPYGKDISATTLNVRGTAEQTKREQIMDLMEREKP